jgi:hypothetical protein
VNVAIQDVKQRLFSIRERRDPENDDKLTQIQRNSDEIQNIMVQPREVVFSPRSHFRPNGGEGSPDQRRAQANGTGKQQSESLRCTLGLMHFDCYSFPNDALQVLGLRFASSVAQSSR